MKNLLLKNYKFSTVDILVPISMKNAANCDTQCELQKPASHQIFERTWRWPYSQHVCFSVLGNHKNNIMRLKSPKKRFLPLNKKGYEFWLVPKRSSHFFRKWSRYKDNSSRTHIKVFLFIKNISLHSAPEIKQDYPLNLSISVSGGKETNKDCPSSGEWTGKSSDLKSVLYKVCEL